MRRQKPRQRGGRVLDKATPEQVMGLARNLPLTHSVLGKALEDATPGQLGFMATCSRRRTRAGPNPNGGGCPDSYETRSVISDSNLESGRWGDVFGDGDMAAAVIDRIVHHGRILRFHGESYRNRHSLMK